MSHLFSSSLHYLQWYGVELMVKPCVLLQTCFKVHQQCSEVCCSQIQGKVLSMFWNNTYKKKKNHILIIICDIIQFNGFTLILDNLKRCFSFEFLTCAIGDVGHKRRQHLDSREAFTLQPCFQPLSHPGLHQLQLLFPQSEGPQSLIHLEYTWDNIRCDHSNEDKMCISVRTRHTAQKHTQHPNLLPLWCQTLGDCCHQGCSFAAATFREDKSDVTVREQPAHDFMETFGIPDIKGILVMCWFNKEYDWKHLWTLI